MNNSTLKWFDWRFAGLMPDAPRTDLLRACLESREPASRAWQRFVHEVGAPKPYFEHGAGGLKGLLPFIELGLSNNGIDPGSEFGTYLRVAVVREELRDDIYRNVFRSVIERLTASLHAPVVLRGLALAETCYPLASRRHNHGIDLLVRRQDLGTASRLLEELGIRSESSLDVQDTVRLCHESGLPVTLRSTLIDLPHATESTAAIMARTRQVELADVTTRIPSPADHLLHVCSRAAHGGSRTNLRWLCDAVLLTRSDLLEWDTFVPAAADTGLALPLASILDQLHRRFTIPVPHSVVPQLRTRHRLGEPAVRSAVHSFAIDCPPPASKAPRISPTTRLRYLWFRAIPSIAYIRWKYHVAGLTATSGRYAHRILRFLGNRLYRTRQVAN